jgi:hypothetical protein
MSNKMVLETPCECCALNEGVIKAKYREHSVIRYAQVCAACYYLKGTDFYTLMATPKKLKLLTLDHLLNDGKDDTDKIHAVHKFWTQEANALVMDALKATS